MVLTKYVCEVCDRDYETEFEAGLCEALGIMPTIPRGTLFKTMYRFDKKSPAVTLFLEDARNNAKLQTCVDKDHHGTYWVLERKLDGDPIEENHWIQEGALWERTHGIMHMKELNQEEYQKACLIFNQYFQTLLSELRKGQIFEYVDIIFQRGTIDLINPNNIPTGRFR